MAKNSALLLVFRSLVLVQESIRLVELALENNPSPDDELELRDALADLESVKDELAAMRDQLENGEVTIPPPGPEVMQVVKDLTRQVEEVRIAGAVANATMGAAGEVLSVGLAIMSLAR
jgi:hypothetical protein